MNKLKIMHKLKMILLLALVTLSFSSCIVTYPAPAYHPWFGFGWHGGGGYYGHPHYGHYYGHYHHYHGRGGHYGGHYGGRR